MKTVQNTRPDFLPFALPDIGEAEVAAVTEVLRSNWLTTGVRTRHFEEEFAQAVDARYAVAVNSCTAALHLALEAIGITRGDEVIVPTYTFAATAEVVRYFDAKPVFVDVDAATLNIDPVAVAAAVTAKTKAVISVDFAGLPADLDALSAIAEQHGIALIEDAAHAFPSRFGTRRIGSVADVTCFSFYATKTITTGEGGMICTDDESIAERCRIMALHGISKDAWKRYTAEGSWDYKVIAPGYKYNLTDIASAIGLVQLEKRDQMWERRCSIARAYNDAFSSERSLQIPADNPAHQHSWHLYPLRLHLNRLSVHRAAFVEELRALNIGTSVHFRPLHMQPYYSREFGFVPGDFPTAAAEFEREISLPIYSIMTDKDVDDVIGAVRAICRRAETAES